MNPIMNYQRTASLKRTLTVSAILIVVSFAGAMLTSSVTKGGLLGLQTARQTKSKAHLLRKKVSLKDTATSPIAIQLNGMQAMDHVNIRPIEKPSIQVVVGQLNGRFDSGMKFDETLPESSLDVTQSGINFTRPDSVGGLVFMDIEVPSSSQIQVTLNGNLLLGAALREPISIRGQEIGQGASNTAWALAQSILPSNVRTDTSGSAYYGRAGKYFVPFLRLHVLKKVELGRSDSPIAAMLQIDESGQTVSVTPIGDTLPSGIEEKLKHWKFSPFEIDGHAVPVTTVLMPKDQ
jgi:hypothetical protein